MKLREKGQEGKEKEEQIKETYFERDDVIIIYRQRENTREKG